MSKDKIEVRDFDGTQTEAHSKNVPVTNLLDGKTSNKQLNHSHNILNGLGVPEVIPEEQKGPMKWDLPKPGTPMTENQEKCASLAEAWAKKCSEIGLNTKLGLEKSATYQQITEALLDQHLCNKEKPYKINFRDGELAGTTKDLEDGKILMDATFTKFPLMTDALRRRPADKGGLGLSEEQANQISLIAGFPEGGTRSSAGKNEHIKLGIDSARAEGKLRDAVLDKKSVTLRDDSKTNLKAAEKAGYNTEHAEHNKKEQKQRLSDIGKELQKQMGGFKWEKDEPPTTPTPDAAQHNKKEQKQRLSDIGKELQKQMGGFKWEKDEPPTTPTPDAKAIPKQVDGRTEVQQQSQQHEVATPFNKDSMLSSLEGLKQNRYNIALFQKEAIGKTDRDFGKLEKEAKRLQEEIEKNHAPGSKEHTQMHVDSAKWCAQAWKEQANQMRAISDHLSDPKNLEQLLKDNRHLNAEQIKSIADSFKQAATESMKHHDINMGIAQNFEKQLQGPAKTQKAGVPDLQKTMGKQNPPITMQNTDPSYGGRSTTHNPLPSTQGHAQSKSAAPSSLAH